MEHARASKSMTTFGNEPDLYVDQELPFTMSGSKFRSSRARRISKDIDDAATVGSNCAMRVSLNGGLTQARWYDLWAAAVAIVGMCSSRNQIGNATVKGSY